MNRNDFRELARVRLREAQALLQAGHYSGAYYLAGYAVECALKACIAKMTKSGDFPDLKTVQDSYTHKLGQLVKVAGLEAERDKLEGEDRAFALNWGVVKDWTEASRYDLYERAQAESLITAVTNRRSGIMRWLRNHW